MPFDSEGNFSRLHNWEDDRINDIDIVTDHMDEEDNNFADGLTQCFLKNGLSKMQADIDTNHFKIKNLANGLHHADAVNKSQLDTLEKTLQTFANALTPPGTILAYAGTTAPTGFLLCDGSAVSRITYAKLFEVIGESYGVGDGSSTFNLPDYKDRTLFMRSDSAIGQVSAGSIPDHRHISNGVRGSAGWGDGSSAYNGNYNTTYASEDTSLFETSLYSKTVNAVIPAHTSCNFIIKY